MVYAAAFSYAQTKQRNDSDLSHFSSLSSDSVTKSIQVQDSSYNLYHKNLQQNNYYKFKYKQLILPVTLIGIGTMGLKNHWLKYQNREIKDELTENINRKTTIDNFSQYAPMAAVYGLNLIGIHGYHNFADRTIILSTSYLIMGIAVNSIKRFAKEERPDGSNNQSFPSGHAATVFMGAEFLWQEYKNVSPWIGIAGYTIAAGTGFLRMHNNKHWFTDIVAGAGFGILSTKMAYWLYPTIKTTFFRGKHLKNVTALPYYNIKSAGIYCNINF